MDNSQEMTTPLNRFFTFWWILAGFAVFGLLALVAYAVSGGKNDDPAYDKAMEKRLKTKAEVVAAQAKQLEEMKFDIAAGVAALSAQTAAATDKAVPGSPTDIARKEEIAKKQAAELAAKSSAGAQKLTVTATVLTALKPGELPLQFAEKELTAVAGTPIEITFINPDGLPHNLVVCKPGTLEAVAALALEMLTDPKGLEKGYIPESDDILANTELLPTGSRALITLDIKESGDYPYLCTFPGHALMRGVLKVTPAK